MDLYVEVKLMGFHCRLYCCPEDGHALEIPTPEGGDRIVIPVSESFPNLVRNEAIMGRHEITMN